MTLGAGEPIVVGDIAPWSAWKGAVYVRWRRLGPPATLTVELRGRRADQTRGKTDDGAGATEASGVRTALETTAEISVQAPFTVSHETTSDYRLHALIIDGAESAATAATASTSSAAASFPPSPCDGTRLLSTIRVSAASSRLAVASVRARDVDDDAAGASAGAEDQRVDWVDGGGDGGAVLSEGDEFLHVSAAAGCFVGEGGGGGGTGLAGKELDVTWRRQAESPGESQPGEDVHTLLPTPQQGSAASATPRDRSQTLLTPPPLTVSLDSPPHIATGHPFTWSVRCANATSLPQPLTVQVADANGEGEVHDGGSWFIHLFIKKNKNTYTLNPKLLLVNALPLPLIPPLPPPTVSS